MKRPRKKFNEHSPIKFSVLGDTPFPAHFPTEPTSTLILIRTGDLSFHRTHSSHLFVFQFSLVIDLS
jgi:hypothetical protein